MQSKRDWLLSLTRWWGGWRTSRKRPGGGGRSTATISLGVENVDSKDVKPVAGSDEQLITQLMVISLFAKGLTTEEISAPLPHRSQTLDDARLSGQGLWRLVAVLHATYDCHPAVVRRVAVI